MNLFCFKGALLSDAFSLFLSSLRWFEKRLHDALASVRQHLRPPSRYLLSFPEVATLSYL